LFLVPSVSAASRSNKPSQKLGLNIMPLETIPYLQFLIRDINKKHSGCANFRGESDTSAT